MGFHTFDPGETDRLEDPSRFRFCSREELLQELPRDGSETILDVGSGTGFYADELAPFVGRLVGLDLQPAMHHQYRTRGVPENVSLVTGEAGSLPLATDTVDGIVSTMTYHESSTEDSASELARILVPDGVYVAVDWSSEGRGASGPPRSERFNAAQASERLAAGGLVVDRAVERSETFLIVARAPT